MSISISNVVFHQIIKNENDELSIIISNKQLNICSVTDELVKSLHSTVTNKAKGFAVFNEDSESKNTIDNIINNDAEFLGLSSLIANKFINELVKYPFSNAGTLVISKYQALATDFLLVALIPTNHGLQVTEQMDLGTIDSLDLNKIDICFKINLTDYSMENESNRYIALSKGRVGMRISDMLLDVLDATIEFDTKSQNRVLVQALNDFCSRNNFDSDHENQLKKQAFDYCKNTKKCGDEINVKELSGEIINSDDGVDFYSFTEQNDYALDDSFPVDSSVTKKLTKFIGSGGGISISFDSIIFNERIFYDADTDTLTIKGTPPNLRHQLSNQSH